MVMRALILLGAAGVLAAPASGQDISAANATTQPTVEKAAPQIAPPPTGMGQIVFYRPSAMGGLVSCRISEDDKVVNRLPPGKYFVQQTAPGIHEYSVHSEAKDVLRVNVEDGETQYARCNIRMGIMVGRPNLSTQDRGDFEKRGKNLKLQTPFDGKEEAKAESKS